MKLIILGLVLLNTVGICQENQAVILRKDDWPKFWIVGVVDESFPKHLNQFDEETMTDYGKRIIDWIEMNPNRYALLRKDTNAINQISYREVYAFNTEQKALFKETSKSFQSALSPQKERYYAARNTYKGTKNKTKPKDSPVIYLLSLKDLQYWKRQTGL